MVRFKEFFIKSLFENVLLEGGNAIKGASKVSQAEIKEVSSDLINLISDTLYLSTSKVKIVGSAGKKPDPEDLSGDIDIAIECSPKLVEDKLKSLSKNNRAMPGINVFSFAYEINGKQVQVDLIPVSNIKYAEWSYQADADDLKAGLKGAHRNELMFAIAKYLNNKVMERDKKTDEPIKIKRYFYDLSQGLMIGVQSRIGKRGKIVKNFSTQDKKLFTNDPKKITKIFFGDHVSPDQVLGFQGTFDAIMSPEFPGAKFRDKILEQARQGIKNKGLVIPSIMKS